MPLPEGTPEYLTMEELYDLYVQFEEDFLEACVTETSLPWLKQHYQNSMRPKSFPDFCGWWSTLPATSHRYYQDLWENGFAVWQERTAVKAAAIEQRIAREGIPVHIRECVEALMRQLEAAKTQERD